MSTDSSTELQDWIKIHTAEFDRLMKEANEREERKRQEAIREIRGKIEEVLSSWNFPLSAGTFDETGHYHIGNVIFSNAVGYNDGRPGVSYDGQCAFSAEEFALLLRRFLLRRFFG